ncbi:hypothetical protein EK904_010535, partial [Melospiza melodia maxima]
PYECSECGKRFNRSFHLIRHLRCHTWERPYKCLDTSSNLIQHQNIHTGKRPCKCEECGNSFKESSHLINHQKSTPPNVNGHMSAWN